MPRRLRMIPTAVLFLTCLCAQAEPPCGDLAAPPAAPVAAPDEGPEVMPISLAVALRLAQTNNLDIAQARETVNQADAVLLRARAQILPNLNLGSTYNHHDGSIQKTEGNIITANRDSLFVGLGPQLTVSFTDAIFGPLVARQVSVATQAGQERVTANALLEVADTYFNVLRARRRLARVELTLEYLLSETPAVHRAGAKGLLPLVRAHAEAGSQAVNPGEVARVEVEVLRRQEERRAAWQDLRIAVAELARLLRLDPETPLWPVEDIRFPLPLSGDVYSKRPVEELVAVALTSRPELAENRALVEAALARVRAAQYRPFIPSVVMGYSYGDFGGGPDLNPPIVVPSKTPGGAPTLVAQPGFGGSGHINHFEPRTDFDVSLQWRLQNFGLGNRAEVREQEALQRQAVLRQIQAQDRVVTQVVQSHEWVQGWRERLAITRSALFDERNAPTGPVFRSLELNFRRIRGQEGRPLEVLDSIRGLSDLLEAYGQAMTDYERARFRLLVALGLPPQALLESVLGDPSAPCNDAVPDDRPRR